MSSGGPNIASAQGFVHWVSFAVESGSFEEGAPAEPCPIHNGNAPDPSTDKILRTLATQLIQVRKSKERCHVTKSHLGAMGMKAQAMKSQVALTQAVGKTAMVMKAANSAVDVQKLNKTMQEFARQNERMDVTEEMMDSALADAFDDDGVEEEADELTGQVLAELGLEVRECEERSVSYSSLHSPMYISRR